MGFLSSIFGGGKKSKAAGPPVYVRPSDPISAQDNFAKFSGLTPWRDAAGAASTAAATRLQQPGSGILGLLQQRAASELQAGGDLSPEEIRAATMGGRAAAQARGLTKSPSGILMEILGRAQYANARKQQRQDFASGVAGLEQQQQQNDLSVLNSTTGSALAGLALPEEIRQFDTTRNDTLAFNQNNWEMDRYTADRNASAANKAGKQSAIGSAVGGLLSWL